jgi:hypothetical protein
VVTKKLAKQAIAKMIGASREIVSWVMKDLQSGRLHRGTSRFDFSDETMLTID